MRLQFVVALLIARGLDAQTPRMIVCDRNEPVALRSAPPEVTRGPKDTLRIAWKNGVTILADSGRHRDESDGYVYEYCGFDAISGFYLVSRFDWLYFSGVVVDQRTGRVLPAGHSVLFSPDGSRYLAVVQADGAEAPDWNIRTRDGRLLWNGPSGINAFDPGLKIEMTYGTLDDPHWAAGNELRATIHCFTRPPRGTVVLSEKNGAYAWQTVASCPKGGG